MSITICVICGASFDAHTSYGLCAQCWSRDKGREFDRLKSAEQRAMVAQVPATLTLPEWISILNDFDSKCALCRVEPYREMGRLDPCKGLNKANTLPLCRGCAVHLRLGFEAALERVRGYCAGVQTQEATFAQVVPDTYYWESLL